MLIYLLLLFWLPGIFIFTRNLLWDIWFWQSKDYNFDHLYSNIRYEFEPSNRSQLLTVVKLILFLVLSSIVLEPTNALLLVAAFFVYAIYIAELFITLERIISGKYEMPQFSLINIISFSFAWLLGTAAAIILSIPLLTGGIISSYDQLVSGGELNSLIVALPSLLVLIITGTMLYIALDLGSPLLSTVGVIIGRPFAEIKHYLQRTTVRHIIEQVPQLKVVAITGGLGKTTTREILANLIAPYYATVNPPVNFATDSALAGGVIKYLTPETEVAIIGIDPYSQYEANQIRKLISPDFLVVTNIDSVKPALHKSRATIYRELLRSLKPGAVSVLNGDDADCLKLAGINKGNEILFFTNDNQTTIQKTIGRSGGVHPLLLNSLAADNVKLNKGKLEFDLFTNNINLHIATQATHAHLASNYVAAISVALALGIPFEKIAETLENLPAPTNRLNTVAGISDSNILLDLGSINISGMRAALNVLKKMPSNQRIVITRGIPHLGEAKTKSYENLTAGFKGIDLLVTTDHKLATAVKSATAVIYVRNQDELIYQSRKHISANDSVLLAGELSTVIINSLISEE